MHRVTPWLFSFLLILCIGLPNLAHSQRVGLVLSGGGAAGLSHVGVIKALEENNIPIDFIAGTSMGALVGSLYAAGYSTDEMTKLFSSEEFLHMTQGKVEDDYIYHFQKPQNDASWISIKFFKDTAWKASIPTNFISPAAMDIELMERLAGAASRANYNFDSLMVPFRCVASDIRAKRSVVFGTGDLSQAVRASMTYPFYMQPITVNGQLLFDGGLYNNFPIDVMDSAFAPDILIGSNVSSQVEPPTEDDLILQIKNMLIKREKYQIDSEKGWIVSPDVIDVGAFEFTHPKEIIDSGYVAAIRDMDSIKALVNRRVSQEDLALKRMRFRKGQKPLEFKQLIIEGLNKRQSKYVENIMWRKRDTLLGINRIKPSYYRVFGDNKIKSIYPRARYNQDDQSYDLLLNIKREQDLIVDFGGNFSSRPINVAFLSLKYNHLGKTGIQISGNSYFGNLYGSIQGKVRIDFPTSLPFFIEPEFTLNRWNYFKSRATFFEENKPSYLVQNEQFGGINIGMPAWNKGTLKGGISVLNINDEYYQTKDFTQTDTADETTFDGMSVFLQYEKSTLNHKLYPNQGRYLSVRTRLIDGEEFNEPGSTSDLNRNYRKLHNWFQLKVTYDNYYQQRGRFRLGIMLEGVFSTQELFNNYTATVLRAPAFIPTPESKTLFLETFRAFQYVAGGHKFIIHIANNLDLRLEGYIFQPYREILKDEEESVVLADKTFNRRFTIATANAVYTSPVGPVSLGLNYYHNTPEVSLENDTPLTFLFHFGYIIFNNRATD